MEFKTARSHYLTFFLMLSAIVIVLSIVALADHINWPAMLIVSAIVLCPYLLFNVILSINVIDDHLVLKTTQLFRKRTTLINIKEVELQLFYTPPKPRRKEFYSMYVMRNNKVLHEIEYDAAELSAFILHFNQTKSRYLTEIYQ